MSIPDYTNRRPQSFIYQNKEVIDDGVVVRNNAFICGKVTATGEGIKNTFDADRPIIRIASPEDIVKNFGEITLENELAFACQIALNAGNGKAIYADVANTPADYVGVIAKIANTDLVQFIAPLRSTTGGTDVFKTHVDSVSNATKQKWRRAYLATETAALDDAAAVKAAVKANSSAMDSDRVINVWCDGAKVLIDNEELDLPNYFIAAGIAALRASLPPQQGLSMQTLGWISSTPLMYTKWSDDDLDDIAADGTFIITQDYDNSDVYIRHQLTTDVDNGVMYWEDSVGTNLDEISYAAKDIVRLFIGKRNGTPETLTELKNRFYDMLLDRTNTANSASTNYSSIAKIGPQIISIIEGSVKCFIDPNMKDRIRLTATVELPLPINTIVVNIDAIASIA